MSRRSNYDKFPTIEVPGLADEASRGWDAIAARLLDAIAARQKSRTIVAIECYPGVLTDEIVSSLRTRFASATWIDSADAMLPGAEIDGLVQPDLGEDPVFGRITRLSLEEFFCRDKLSAARRRVAAAGGVVIVCGTGSALVVPSADVLVYADLPRREIQQRQRRGQIGNLGVENVAAPASAKYKRAFFVDWRVCDRHKLATLGRADFVLDTTVPADPRLITGSAFGHAMAHCVTRPLRVVPFFDPGPWGGQWMKQVCDLDPSAANYAWCFDCVPEENSLLLRFGDVRLEVPALDLVFAQPQALLGEPAHGRFGREFPIRFDLLDTMDGGNLSLQVHPLTEHIQQHFGMQYTQDESYYVLDAGPDAAVFLGRRRGADMDQMFRDLQGAHQHGQPFDASHYAAQFHANKHDHFLIPAGTLHCLGRNCMVLEISATPYIFTFKLWDWSRLGLDGAPRPIHLEHGRENLQWERDEDYARRRLINHVRPVARGNGWEEERTGLHESQFIETRRHWFTAAVLHDTRGQQCGSVNVLNLIEGDEAIVESPENAFEPFIVHYAETFIVPAAVGPYRIRPLGSGRCGTIKAFVRTNS